jgi:tRNA A37 threonylcarbamoyladenosine synthetase subunit TsaC/SUA5/YrdC
MREFCLVGSWASEVTRHGPYWMVLPQKYASGKFMPREQSHTYAIRHPARLFVMTLLKMMGTSARCRREEDPWSACRSENSRDG